MNNTKYKKSRGSIFIYLIILAGALGMVFIGLQLGSRLIDFVESKLQKRGSLAIPRDFRISFENQADFQLFKTNNAASEISVQYVTDGSHSLMVEYPAGVEVAELVLEAYGKDSFNWKSIKGISFDITNPIDAEARLKLVIKSGKKDSQKSFEKELTIPALKTIKFIVKSEELENHLDMREISYINFFMRDPGTTFKLYFDNFQLIN